MKTKYKYINFTKDDMSLIEKELVLWRCWNNRKKKILLGNVCYVPEWKEWEFQPESMTGFTIVCLQDIAHFIGQLNEQGSEAATDG